MGPIGPGQNLGGATFQLVANQQPLVQGLQQAQGVAQQAANQIGSSLTQGTQKAAMGLLQLSHAIDDAQYGFQAIVNNIPGIAQSLSGSAGIAGAAGIAAVAVYQFIKNWQDLKEAVGDVAWLNDASRGLAGMVPDSVASYVKDVRGVQKDIAQKRQDEADRKDTVEKSRKQIEGLQTKDEKVRAKAFAEALAEYGPDLLRNQLINRSVGGRKLSEEQRAQVEQNVDMMIARGMRGQFGTGREFGNSFYQKYFPGGLEAQQQKKKIDDQLKAATQAADERLKASREETRQLNEQGKGNERFMMAQLEAERHRKQKQLSDHQDYLSNIRSPQMFGSSREYLSSVTVSGADAIRKQHLDVSKQIKRGIDKLSDQIWKVGQARFQ